VHHAIVAQATVWEKVAQIQAGRQASDTSMTLCVISPMRAAVTGRNVSDGRSPKPAAGNLHTLFRLNSDLNP